MHRSRRKTGKYTPISFHRIFESFTETTAAVNSSLGISRMRGSIAFAITNAQYTCFSESVKRRNATAEYPDREASGKNVTVFPLCHQTQQI